MLENHYLIEHPRVIVTPHVAFNTIEAIERIVDTTVENIKRFAEGTPTNVVS
jgi:D-lactate dehydrogenase